MQITSKSRIKFHHPAPKSAEDHFIAEPKEVIHEAPDWVRDTPAFAFYSKHGEVKEVLVKDGKPKKD